jgi:16S rRNA (cytosine1402-N4)-methyltransferase
LIADAAHRPVLLEEAATALALKPSGTYVDATFGRGGHSRRILDGLGRHGRLIALDRDPEAQAAAAGWSDRRFHFRHARFSALPQILDEADVARIDGILLDLGISSPQIDDPVRGFSFRTDGPLDMRMDSSHGETAAQWIASAPESELREVIATYGEERFAKQVARAIVAARARQPIVRTRQLAAIVAEALGARTKRDRSQDPATRTFQAVRIHLNQELEELSLTLDRVLPRVATGGRIAVISFHSLEDRIVKEFLRRHSQPFGGDVRLARMAIAERALPVPPLKLIGRATKPDAEELEANPRARSARLRVAERTEGAIG